MSEQKNDPASEKKLERASHIIDIALKVLAALVIPIILWGVRLEVKQAVVTEKIASKEVRLQETIKSVERQLRTEISICRQNTDRRRNDIHAVQQIVQNNSSKLSALSAGIAAANKRLDDILKYFSKESK